MFQQVYEADNVDKLFSEVEVGMPVFDLAGEKVGVVKYVQNANHSKVEPAVIHDQHVRDAPRLVRDRLVRAGFIRIDGGLLRPTYYATGEQIASVMANSVQLYAMREELWTL